MCCSQSKRENVENCFIKNVLDNNVATMKMKTKQNYLFPFESKNIKESDFGHGREYQSVNRFIKSYLIVKKELPLCLTKPSR